VRARRNLGRALADTGDLAGARVEFERALQINPADAEARQDLGLILQALRKR
jgi:Flp pilus assembly protein TadD